MIETFLIVALGNPSDRYKYTRHNAGFIVADALAREWQFSDFSENKKCHALISRDAITIDDVSVKVIIAKPLTFMNHSGRATQALLKYFDIPNANLVVIHDDSDFSIGTYFLQKNRGAGGHNGVASIIKDIGTQDFSRIRIGVRPRAHATLPTAVPRPKAMTFVLNDFATAEKNILESLVPQVRLDLEKLLTLTK